MRYVGFSVGGVEWLWTDLVTSASPSERLDRLRTIGHEEARLTRQLGGNLLRVFFSFASLLREFVPNPQKPGMDFTPKTHEGAWHLLPDTEKIAALDQVLETLETLHARLTALPANGQGLAFEDLDGYLDGVRACNETQRKERSVRVLLTLVALPPVQILEAPAGIVLSHYRRRYTFNRLWELYIAISIRLWRMVVRRYVVEPREHKVVCALEMNNEPDYEWLPDEVRIEKALDPNAYPLSKYITELHQPQIPEGQRVSPPFERSPWGTFKEQLGMWTEAAPASKTPVMEFNWGPKFDWYVRCYAELSVHMSYAVMHESRSAGCNDLDIVSAGVTHNNIDYLIRMYRANPQAFQYCTAIGLHPYHWPEHNVHDTQFVSPYDLRDWRSASPREFAMRFFKRFDFFTEAARLTRLSGPESFGLEGKKLWLTEFGIGSKIMGAHNYDHAEFVGLIRPRAIPADALPFKSAVWEDLWDAFFDQITPAYLDANNCPTILFYTLRETACPAFDKHDDDRSNMALIRRDGSPRMDPQTFLRFRSFMSAATGEPDERDVIFSNMPIWARGKSYSNALLRSRPWLYTPVPNDVLQTISMLSEDEKRFLYWCTAHFYENKGEIVELGPFAGGSSVAFARGLQSAWQGSQRTVKVYDLFRTDEYMDKYYFEPNGLSTIDGNFRHIYDKQTAGCADLLTVYEGDVTKTGWNGDPIEILFIDIAKMWHVNDHVNRTFMPHLIPGKSLVIQQDFFHQWECWTVLTMELLRDYFEYVGFVRWNSAVYRCTRAVPLHVIPEDLRSLGLDRLRELMNAAIERHKDGYLRGMLNTALIGLLKDFGAHQDALQLGQRVARNFSDQPIVIQAVKDLGCMV